MLLNYVFKVFDQILAYNGSNSLLQKENTFFQLIKDSDGQILKLFDAKFKMQLNVNISTIKKTLLHDALTNVEPITLKNFIALNEKILTITGKDSVIKKQDLLAVITNSCDLNYHKYLLQYYRSGIFKINFNEKRVLNLLKKQFSEKVTEIENYAKNFHEYSLYQVYVNCTTNINQKPSEKPDSYAKYKPMLASTYEPRRLEINRYYAQPKLDGFRILIRKEDKKLYFWSRAGIAYNTSNFLKIMDPIIVDLLKINSDYVIDGEIWLKDQSQETFRLLSPLIKTKNLNETYFNKYSSKIRLTIFDILELNKVNVCELKYLERKKLLQELKLNCLVDYTKVIDENSISELMEKTLALNLEGLVLKEEQSIYEFKRSNSWMKIKPKKDTIDLKIITPIKGVGKYESLYASFEVGTFVNNELVSLGRVGSGLSEKELNELNSIITKGNLEELPLFQISADTITQSDKYSSGYALRFPRVVRIRYDKTEPNELDYIVKILKGV